MWKDKHDRTLAPSGSSASGFFGSPVETYPTQWKPVFPPNINQSIHKQFPWSDIEALLVLHIQIYIEIRILLKYFISDNPSHLNVLYEM